jgi:hypothetical protein
MQKQLDKAFAELNKIMFARQIAWAKSRKEAMIEAEKKHVAENGFKGLTEAKIEAAGGKTWYGIFNGRNWSQIAELVERNVENMIAKRDARIIKALNKKGIEEISDFELTHTSNGYEGYFNVDGHTVKIETILAGGYNIQCLHQRTLVKVL